MNREPNQKDPARSAPDNGAFTQFRVDPATVVAIQRARRTNPDQVAKHLSLEHLKATARHAAIKDMNEAHRLAEVNANLLERRLNAMPLLKRPGRTIRVASTFVDRSTGFMADVFIHENSEPGSPWAADPRAARSELLSLFEVVEEQAPNFFLSPPTALRGTHQGTRAADRHLWTISRDDKGDLKTEGFGIIDHSDLQPDVKEGHHHDRTAEELERRTAEESREFLESGARLEAALSRHEGERLSLEELRSLARGKEPATEKDKPEVSAVEPPDDANQRIPRSDVPADDLRKHSERLMRENFGDGSGQRAEAREPERSLEERPLEERPLKDRVAGVRDEQWNRAALEAERGGPGVDKSLDREPDGDRVGAEQDEPEAPNPGNQGPLSRSPLMRAIDEQRKERLENRTAELVSESGTPTEPRVQGTDPRDSQKRGPERKAPDIGFGR